MDRDGNLVSEGQFENGDMAIIIVTPSDGWRFAYWSGDVSGPNETQAITMDRNKAITAHFDRKSPTGSSPATSPSDLPPGSRIVQIDAGEDHTCAVTQTRIAVCWGRDDAGQAKATEGTFTFVSAGAQHSCAVTSNNRIDCWGSNSHGQLNVPRDAEGPVSAGFRTTCSDDDDYSRTQCWGSTEDAPRSLSQSPAQVGVGEKHACRARHVGYGWADEVLCAGDNVYGQAEDLAINEFAGLSVGANHNCVRDRSGEVTCWGRNRYGQTAVPSGTRFIDISAGTSHTCGVNASNEIDCWGLNASGQTNAPGGDDWMLAAAGGSHSCAVNEDGKVACWGANGYGQLNVPAGIAAPAPPQRPTSTPQVTQTPVADDDGDFMQGAISVDVRIIARRAADGRIEFGTRMSDGREQFPTARFFPAAGPGHGRWLRSSVLDFGNGFRGRIIARYHAFDGRTEFGLRIEGFPNDMFPQARFFPASPAPNHGRWLRSSVLSFGN